jgi:hypothetical protein
MTRHGVLSSGINGRVSGRHSSALDQDGARGHNAAHHERVFGTEVRLPLQQSDRQESGLSADQSSVSSAGPKLGRSSGLRRELVRSVLRSPAHACVSDDKQLSWTPAAKIDNRIPKVRSRSMDHCVHRLVRAFPIGNGNESRRVHNAKSSGPYRPPAAQSTGNRIRRGPGCENTATW